MCCAGKAASIYAWEIKAASNYNNSNNMPKMYKTDGSPSTMLIVRESKNVYKV